MSDPESSSTSRTPAFELTASRQFTAWLAEQKLSLAFTTYQAGKLFLLGLQPDGRLSIFNRTFERCIRPVAAMPGVARPMALGFRSDEIRRTITKLPQPAAEAV